MSKQATFPAKEDGIVVLCRQSDSGLDADPFYTLSRRQAWSTGELSPLSSHHYLTCFFCSHRCFFGAVCCHGHGMLSLAYLYNRNFDFQHPRSFSSRTLLVSFRSSMSQTGCRIRLLPTSLGLAPSNCYWNLRLDPSEVDCQSAVSQV